MTQVPRVLIGSPTAAPYAYCLQEWVDAVRSLTYPNVSAVLVDNSKDAAYDQTIQSYGIQALKYKVPAGESLRATLANSRNMLRDMVLHDRFDYFLSLEQDILPPVDVIQRLLAHQQPVVSGVYYKYFTLQHTSPNGKIMEKKKAMPLLARSSGDSTMIHYFTAEEVEEPRLLSIRYCGLGCVLIHKDVLQHISFRIDPDSPGKAFDDVPFCNDVLTAGYHLYADTSVKCMHRLSGKPAGLFNSVHK